jgi:hypothetical protein
MKTSLTMALFAVIASLAGPAPLAFAKTGDQYVNKDGSCDPGDKKKGYWCIESMTAKPAGGGRDARILPTASNSKAVCTSGGGVWAGEEGKGSCTAGPKK